MPRCACVAPFPFPLGCLPHGPMSPALPRNPPHRCSTETLVPKSPQPARLPPTQVFNGGSDFNEPVRRCLDRLTDAKWANSDILLVSGGWRVLL